MASSTYSVKELAEMTGVSTDTIYKELNETGSVMGVRGIRIRRRWVLPRALVEQSLGLGTNNIATAERDERSR